MNLFAVDFLYTHVLTVMCLFPISYLDTQDNKIKTKQHISKPGKNKNNIYVVIQFTSKQHK